MPSPAFRSNQPPATAAQLKIIRGAMLAGMVGFGALAAYMARHREQPAPPDGMPAFQWAALALAVAMGAGIVLMKRRHDRVEGAAKNTCALIAGAMAEGIGFFGAVIMLLGGAPWVWALGIVMYAAAWQALPGVTE